jgi:hypothetical protein
MKDFVEQIFIINLKWVAGLNNLANKRKLINNILKLVYVFIIKY